MPRDVCVIHPLYHRLHFVPSHPILLSDAASVHWFTDVMNLSVATVSTHTSMPKEDILAFTATQEYTRNLIYLVNFVNNKAKWWHCVRYVNNFSILIICKSQGSVATR